MDLSILKQKSEQLGRMLETLHEAIEKYEREKRRLRDGVVHDDSDVRTCQDSVIQRFEYTIDGLWKCLRLHLINVDGVVLEGKGPKGIVRAACLYKAISEAEAEQLLEMIEMRNQTSHLYKEEVASQVALAAVQGYPLLAAVYRRLSTNVA